MATAPILSKSKNDKNPKSPSYLKIFIVICIIIAIIVIPLILFTRKSDDDEDEPDNDDEETQTSLVPIIETTSTPSVELIPSETQSPTPTTTEPPIPDLENGAIFKCQNDPFTSFYQYNKNTGKKHYLLNQTVVNRCNFNASTLSPTIDCRKIPDGPSVTGVCPDIATFSSNTQFYPVLENGATVFCQNVGGPLFHYNDGKIFHYAGPSIAGSCKTDWQTNRYEISCSGLDTYRISASCPATNTLLTPNTTGVIPTKSSTLPPLSNGSPIRCETDPLNDGVSSASTPAIYQYRDGVKYWLSSRDTQNTCNPNWSSNLRTVNCTAMKSGPRILGTCPPVPAGQSFSPVLENGSTVVCQNLPNTYWQYNDGNIFHYKDEQVGSSCKSDFKTNNMEIDCSGLQKYRVDSNCTTPNQILTPQSTNVLDI